VSRWVNAHGKISLGGFTYAAGASYAGEPVEVVVAGGLVDILHAGVVIATHAQRFRPDQADRAPRMPVARRARDATAGLTVTRLANGAGASLLPSDQPGADQPDSAGHDRDRAQVSVSVRAADRRDHPVDGEDCPSGGGAARNPVFRSAIARFG
jgi:hypothetical protein